MTDEPQGIPSPKRGDELPDFLTTKQAAELTNVSVAWYKKARYNGYGPPFVRRGRIVRYEKDALLYWWDRFTVEAEIPRTTPSRLTLYDPPKPQPPRRSGLKRRGNRK